MIFKKHIAIWSLAALSAFALCVSVYAQQDDPSLSKDILLTLSPAYPGPHEQVRVAAQTFSFDVNAVSLSWHVNGTLVKSGKGVTDIMVTTGSMGTPTSIMVTAAPPTATQYKNSLTIWPSSLDVLWYTDTYTPPGYQGKALPVRGSVITLVAMPSFVTKDGSYDQKTLLYEWRIDNILQKTASGKGKNTFLLAVTKNKNVPPQAVVRVYNENKTITQEKRVEIAIREPELLFYELHPLQGPLYQQAIGNTFQVASGGETRILAEPYYTSGESSFLRYQWNIDNTNISSDSDHPEILSYSTESGSRAQQTIALEITNPFNILEQIRKSFRIHVE